ncbi:hypothetical protein [Noviherbaspirillum sp. UKPF54]|uniref:hypothetical protein n=1 Tax=Noviherbaspirillum sp. UKPF54 TaxID=2601898 RepID=UPI0011B19138|nr:hypothetical protein [Noviherbaspirillum sp. UKPF54]QDZ26573.1 hypothetical protein FAY22_00475 [Noviherbaspirillum sp. UKPF54]
MTFRNLPLTPDQDAEVRAYIERCNAVGEPWDTLQLDYMINDMLRENEERAIGARVPRVLLLLTVESMARDEGYAGRRMPSTQLRELAAEAGLDRFLSPGDLADVARRQLDELIPQHSERETMRVRFQIKKKGEEA